jgi:RNA polymerase sigma-70 factor (ECF subfamily)
MNEKGYQLNESSDSFTILQKIANGDKQAVSECFDTYGNQVWRIARRHINTMADAEDAVQEIFIDIWKNAARFDPAKSPEGAFIALIARRRLIDRLRSEYRRPQTSSFKVAPERYDSDEHAKLQMSLEIKPALKALSKLKLHQKKLIVMSVYDGMSHSEISSLIGLPLGTVKTNIRRGLQKMRLSMESAKPLPI